MRLKWLDWKQKKTTQSKKNQYQVVIVDIQGSKQNVAYIMADAMGISLENAVQKLSSLPLELSFNTKKKACAFVKSITEAGGTAILKT